MKHLIICLLVVFLTACSESASRTTPLVEMTKYEIENHEQLQELEEMEYVTYAEMKEEPAEDWLFDMEKRVMEDDAIVGYEFSFPETDDQPGITVDEFNQFLDFAINADQPFNIEENENIEPLYEGSTLSSYMFKVDAGDERYLVTYYTEKKYYYSDEYFISSGAIYLAD